MFRYVFVLCLLALVAISVNAEVEETVNDIGKVETRRNDAGFVYNIIREVAGGISDECVVQASEECKQYSNNPSEAKSCAKSYFKANFGRCALGK